MVAWSASWRPAQGDRVRTGRAGRSGTIVDVKFGGFLVAYDEPASPDLAVAWASEPDPGWHRRDDLEPIDDTAGRLQGEHAPRVLAR